jgi:hypothetical protein
MIIFYRGRVKKKENGKKTDGSSWREMKIEIFHFLDGYTPSI